MDFNRLFQCQEDDLGYIKHLELRILKLESACSSRCLESLGSQQRMNEQCKPCEVCCNLDSYQDQGFQRTFTDSLRLASESCHDDRTNGIRLGSESSPDDQSSQHNKSSNKPYPFIIYEPIKTASSVRKDSSKGRLSSFTSSVGKLPQSSAWKNWTTIHETQRKKIVLALVSGLTFPKEVKPIASEQPKCVSLLQKYGASMEPVDIDYTSPESEAKRPFAYFQELIYCSLCAVALEVNPKAKEIVLADMRSVLRCDAQEKTLRRRIRGAKWANQVIHLLSRTNWSSHSWDIIYVATNKVNFYSDFNDYSIQPDELIKGLKPESIPKDPQTISVPLAIPSIIRTIFENSVPLGNICKCLGYELCDYNQLDLSGLEKLLAVSANTDPDDTEPNGPGPNDAESTDTESNDTEPKKKRKKGPLESSSKRRCRDVSPGSPEGGYCETLNGSPWSIDSMPTPSAPGSSSDSVRDGPFEEFPTSTSSPTEDLLDIDASEEMVGSRVGDANCSPLASNHSPQQGILQSHVDQLFHRGDDIPGIALPRDAGSRTSSAVIIPDFESVSRDDQLSTADLSFGMNGTLDLESNSAPTMSRSTSKGLSKRPRLERSGLLSLPPSQSVNQMPSQLEYADQVSNNFQQKPPLDENLARPFEDLTSWSWNTASQDIRDGALNEFQLEALGDENLARPFEDLTSWSWNTASQDIQDGALNEFQPEALGDENLAHPFKDHFPRSRGKDTGPQIVDEEALNAGPFQSTFSQPPSWDMESQGFDQGSGSFQDTSPTKNNLAHHSTRLFLDDELRYMSEGWNGPHFLTPANTSHAQPTSYCLSQSTEFVANETLNSLQNEIRAN